MILFLLCLSAFSNTLSEPEVRRHTHGVVVTLRSDNDVSIRVLSMESGCLYVFSKTQFTDEGIIDATDERIGFFQKKNIQDDAQLLIGFARAWTCFEPEQTSESISLRIGEADWKLEEPVAPPKASHPKQEDVLIVELPVQKREENSREKPYLVAIDAGHGGWDAGAVGSSGLREADVVLSLALRLSNLLQGKGYSVLLIRDTDVFVPLKERALIANQSNADIFISLHANAAPTSDLYGIETFSMDTASDDGAKKVAKRENTLVKMEKEQLDNLKGSLVMQGSMKLSKTLAAMVQRNVMTILHTSYGELHTQDLGAKTALFYVLVYTKMPSILFEASFLSNPEDERMLRAPHFHDTLMMGVANAIDEYFHIQE